MSHLSERLRGALGLVGLSLVAVVVGKLSATRPTSAASLVLVPLVVLSAMAPLVPLLVAVALLPFQSDNLGTTLAGLRVGPSDVLMLLGVGGIALHGLGGSDLHLGRLRPLVPVLTVYFTALTVAWAHLPSSDGVATIVQRLQLVVAAAVVGVYLAAQGRLDAALRAYLYASTVLAVVAVVYAVTAGAAEEFLGVQKNPAGQAIANGLLIALLHRNVPSRVPLCVVLAFGLVAAQSRGAILAVVVAVAVATLLVSSGRRLRALALVPIMVGVAFIAFSALPAAQQERLVNDAPQGDVATETRQEYAEDAIVKIKSSPVLGTGVGLYEAGEVADQTFTDDPHNVALLEAAEGGAVLLGGFGVLTLGSVWVLWRRRRSHPVVVVAIAVQVSIVLHGVVDVYWVRGTPVLGWLLVGGALYLAAGRSRPEPDLEAPADLAGHPAPDGGAGAGRAWT